MDFEVIDDVVMEDAECPTADGVIDHEKENGGIVTSSLDAEKHKETAKAKEMTLLERFEHKNWKVRAEAYEEANAQAAAARDIWDTQGLGGSVLAKAITDSNAPAQEKALDLMCSCLLQTTESFASKFSKPIMKSVVQKCFNGRAGTVGKATEVSMLLIELGEEEEVVAAFIGGTSSKQAKVVLASLNAVSEAVNSFGARTINCKTIIKELPRLFDSRDSKVRDKVKELTVDLCMWLGLDTMRALLLEKMRDAMRKDVETIVSGRDGQKMRPTRRLRRDTGGAETSDDAASGEDGEKEATKEEAVPDAYDLSDGVNILCKINDKWYSRLEASKWSERKAALSELATMASSVPKIEPGDFHGIVNAIERLMKNDSNVAVVTEAINAVIFLSKGLRKSFASNARQLLPLVIDKLKEKGVALVRACQEALRVWTTYCIDVDIADEVCAALKHKVPKVRMETLRWVLDAVGPVDSAAANKLSKALMPALVGATADSAAEVRDAAIQVIIVMVQKAGGLRGAMAKALQGLDARQLKKVKASVEGDVGGGSEPSAKASGVSNALCDKPTNIQSSTIPTRKPASGRGGAAASASGRSTERASSGSRPKASRNGGATGKAKKAKDDCVEPILADRSPEEAESIVNDLIGEANVTLIKSANWKERLDGISNISDWAGQSDREVARSQMECLASVLCRHPSWEDKNVQVLSRLAETFSALSSLKSFSRKEIFIVMSGKAPATEKFCDTKLKVKVGGMLSCFAEAVGLQFIVFLLERSVGGHKNPKVIAESLNWLAQALVEFGAAGVKTKETVDWMKICLDSSNQAVRTSAIKVLGVLHRTVGPSLVGMLGEIKSALSASIKKEFEKNPHGTVTEPVRTVRGAAAVAAAGAASEKANISGLITSELLSELGSSQWKERAAALERVDRILTEAGGQIATEVGDLVKALQQRLSDKNKNLVVTTLNLVGRLATAMGKPFEQAGFKLVIGPVLRTLNDLKKNVRETGCATLTAFTAAVSFNRVLHFLFDMAAEKKFGPDGKRESMAWILSQFDKLESGSPFLTTIMKYALEGMEDRAGDVREVSTALVKEFAKSQREILIKFTREQSMAHQALLQGLLLSNDAQEPENASAAPVEGVSASSLAASPARPQTAPGKSGMLRKSRNGSLMRSSIGVVNSDAKKSMDAVSGPIFRSSDGIDERIRKLSKRSGKGWDPEISLRPESLVDLERDLMNAVREDVFVMMTSPDFRQHCKVIDMVIECLKKDAALVVSNRDHIFKWLVYRFCEGNTTSLVKSLELCAEMLNALKEGGIRLTNGEALILLPCLVEKSGHNSDRVRSLFRSLIKQWTSVYPVSLVCAALIDGISYSKNNRTKVECVESYAENIERHGVESADRSRRGLPLIASLVSERDVALRGAALVALATVYKIQGDGVWKLLGTLTDAQKSLIDDKFKWTAKELGKADASASSVPVASHPAAAAAIAAVDDVVDVSASDVEAADGVAPECSPKAKDPRELMIEEWEAAMRIVGSTNDEEAVQGMKVICRQLVNCTKSKSEAHEDEVAVDYSSILLRYSQDANTLVEILARQTSRVFSVAVSDVENAASTRTCKYVLNTLMHSFTANAMAIEITEGVLRDLATKLLLWLLNSDLPKLEEGTQLLKALNMLMLKVLESSRKTVSFCALIHLIKPSSIRAIEAEYEEGYKQRFVDLVVKCLIKLTKTIGGCIGDVNIERVLLSVHGFFSELTPEEMKRRGTVSSKEDKPLRMVKTLLHELVKLLGPSIRDYTSNIPSGESESAPLVLMYIDLNLQTLSNGTPRTGFDAAARGAQETPMMTPLTRRTNSHLVVSNVKATRQYTSAVTAEASQSGADDQAASSSSPRQNQSPVEPTKKELAEIFKKIGDKRRTSQGLEELYVFREENPEIDISPHLARTSEAFQAYINRGVKRAGEEIKNKRRLSGALDGTGHSDGDGHPMPGNSSAAAASVGPPSLGVGAQQSAVPPSGVAEGAADRFARYRGAPSSRLASNTMAQAAGVANLDALRERMKSIQAQMMASSSSTAPSSMRSEQQALSTTSDRMRNIEQQQNQN